MVHGFSKGCLAAGSLLLLVAATLSIPLIIYPAQLAKTPYH